MHDLLRAYATEQTETHDGDTDRRAALHRMLDHYLHTAHAAARLDDPWRPINLTAAQEWVGPEHLDDLEQALAWFSAEQPVLLATMETAAREGFDTHTWQLASALTAFLDRRGRWHEAEASAHAARAAAERLDDPTAHAEAHRLLGRAYTRLDRPDDALAQLRLAMQLHGEAHDHVGQAIIHNNLSFLWERQGRYLKALHHAEQALKLSEAAGDRTGQARALNDIGWYQTLLGHHEQALATCEQALTIHQQLGRRGGQAGTWDSLGYAHHHLGHVTQAITCYERALGEIRIIEDRPGEAVILSHLGDAHHAASQFADARNYWQHALTILNDLHEPNANDLRTKLEQLDQIQ
jgi:tetratricopeptide (TPR) repeat protein